MQPVPRRVVESYHIRFHLGSIFPDDDLDRSPKNIVDAIDLHVHAQTGTEDPFEIAKAATCAHMGAVVFKNLPGTAPRGQICRDVQEQVNRWAEAERLEPVTCYHGAQTDPGYGGLDAGQIRAAVDDGAAVIWFPVISSAHSAHRVGAPRRVLPGVESTDSVVWPLPWEEALRVGQYLLDEEGGVLKPVAREILRIAAEKGTAVSFAHSSKPEMEALAEECDRLNFHQAFIDHPYGPQIGLELEDLALFARSGIHFNFTYDEISPLLGIDPQDMMSTIKEIGPEHFTLSSDGGNPLLPGAVDALSTLVKYAKAYGITDEAIHQMTVENPKQVLGVK